MAADEKPRPFKVWDAERKTKKSLVAKSLKELKIKGSGKLGYGEETVKAVLEEDGTEIDDEEYFSCLQSDTVILLLKGGEVWLNPRSTQGATHRQTSCVDHADGDLDDKVDAMTSSGEGKLQAVLDVIKDNPEKILTLSNQEMLVLAQASEAAVAHGLSVSETEALRLQVTCQRYLDDRTTAMDAITLLKSYSLESQSENSSKRQKTN